MDVGKVLMREVERLARERGYSRMHLTVDVNNQKTIGFYERQGWKKTIDKEHWAGKMQKVLEKSTTKENTIR